MWVCPVMGQAAAMGQDGADWHSPAYRGNPLCRDAPLGLSWCRRALGKMLLWGHHLQTHWQSSRGFAAKAFPARMQKG